MEVVGSFEPGRSPEEVACRCGLAPEGGMPWAPWLRDCVGCDPGSREGRRTAISSSCGDGLSACAGSRPSTGPRSPKPTRPSRPGEDTPPRPGPGHGAGAARRRPALAAGSGSIRGPGEVGYLVLSQSEDQNQVHPVPSFVHLMSTQLRSPSLDEVGSAHRSDPQIATRAQNTASRQAA